MKKPDSPYSSGFTQAHAQSYGYILNKANLVNDEIDFQAIFDVDSSKPLPLTVLNLGQIIRSRYIHRYGENRPAPDIPFFKEGSISAREGYNFFCVLDDAISDSVLNASEALDFILDFEKTYSGFYTSGAKEFKEYVFDLYQKEVGRASE